MNKQDIQTVLDALTEFQSTLDFYNKNGPDWHCDCGNELFYVTANGYYCPNCGLTQKGF
jgi:rubrerythrin